VDALDKAHDDLVPVCYSFFFSSRRRHTRSKRDWSSDVCSSDLHIARQVRVTAQGIQRHRIHPVLVRVVKRAERRSIAMAAGINRSEERRVGKECGSRWARLQLKKKSNGGVKEVDTYAAVESEGR